MCFTGTIRDFINRIWPCLLMLWAAGNCQSAGSGEWYPVQWPVKPCAYFGIATDTTLNRVVVGRNANFVHHYKDSAAIWDGEKWSVRYTETKQPDFDEARFVFHESSGDIITYGGFHNNMVNDYPQWRFDGKNWYPIPISDPNPGVRWKHGLVYDSARDRIVLFGGWEMFDEDGIVVSYELRNDTWEWDGEQWHQMDSLTAPPDARCRHAMVYDPVRQATLVTGGSEGSPSPPFFEGTWAWNGIQWDLVSDDGPARVDHRMAWDPLNEQVIAYGSNSLANGTFIWDGVEWTWIDCPTGNILSRAGAGMTWDPVNERMMMLGGDHFDPVKPSYALDEMVWFDGECWQSYELPESPCLRTSFAQGYYPTLQHTVVFGGFVRDTYEYLGDTWTWDGSVWAEHEISGGPYPRVNAEMAYDPVNDAMLLYGGDDYAASTWLWDGEWTEVNLNKPSPGKRSDHGLITDLARHEVLLFGGWNDEGDLTNDTWVWDGECWRDVTPSGPKPEPGIFEVIAYDPRYENVVHLDYVAETYLDTWIWDDAEWTNVSATAHTPQDGLGHYLFYHEQFGQIILCNSSRQGLTYSWDGSQWHEFGYTQNGYGGSSPVTYDSHRDRAVKLSWDTWEYFQIIDVDIKLNKPLFYPGDTFDLTLELINHIPEDRTDLLMIALDVYGELWFWPQWRPYPEYLGYEERIIEPGTTEESILTFTWPETSAQADNLYFHAALLDPDHYLLVAYDNVEWEWR